MQRHCTDNPQSAAPLHLSIHRRSHCTLLQFLPAFVFQRPRPGCLCWIGEVRERLLRVPLAVRREDLDDLGADGLGFLGAGQEADQKGLLFVEVEGGEVNHPGFVGGPNS